MGQRVLVTGAAGHLAAALARRLADDPAVEEVVAVDRTEPEHPLGGARFVPADIRTPVFLSILQTSGADTVVHLDLLATPAGAGGRGRMKEINVIGAMQLFAACQRAQSVRKVVVKSSTAVYGSDAEMPAVFTEEMAARGQVRGGYAKDAVEVEGYARDLTRRREGVALTILRFANFMGPRIQSSLTRYFSLPVVPTPIGYDPRLELIHEDDALEVLERVTREDHPGVFNVSADGIVYLSQALRLLGKPPLPVLPPLGRPLASVLTRLRLVDVAFDQLPLLLHGRVTDNARLKRTLGWEPKFDTRAALLDVAAAERRRIEEALS